MTATNIRSFSLLHVWGGQSDGAGLSAHLDEQERQWRELRRTDIDGDAKACADAANSFVQNVYRFFKLFRRKNEFVDPFVKPINPLSTPLLSQHLGSDAEALSIAAEFYFRRGHYSEALQLFNRIEELTPTLGRVISEERLCAGNDRHSRRCT